MNNLSVDEILYICKFLELRDKIAWLSTCKYSRSTLARLRIKEAVDLDSALRCPYQYRCIFLNIIAWHNFTHYTLRPFREIFHNLQNMTFNITKPPIGFSDMLQGLQRLKFLSYFDSSVTLPNGLQAVYFGPVFNRPIVLPPGLKIAVFGWDFNQNVTLPEGLIFVIFDYRFDKHVDLPNTLISASFGDMFNQKIILPDSLKKVSFGKNFNQDITLPAGLTTAKFHKNYTGKLTFPAKNSLVDLFVGINYPHELPGGNIVNKWF